MYLRLFLSERLDNQESSDEVLYIGKYDRISFRKHFIDMTRTQYRPDQQVIETVLMVEGKPYYDNKIWYGVSVVPRCTGKIRAGARREEFDKEKAELPDWYKVAEEL